MSNKWEYSVRNTINRSSIYQYPFYQILHLYIIPQLDCAFFIPLYTPIQLFIAKKKKQQKKKAKVAVYMDKKEEMTKNFIAHFIIIQNSYS